jgi:hypothetical protein
MMLSMQHRVLGALVFSVAVLAAGNALAASVATTDPATSIRSRSAVLNGFANPPSSNSAWFFQYAAVGTHQLTSTTPTKFTNTNPQSVSLRVTGLTAGATYFFRFVVVQIGYHNTFYPGSYLSFTTPNGVATTGNATSVTNRSALLNGVVNVTDPNSAWLFQYGTTTSYSNSTKPQVVGAGVTLVSVQLSGLSPGKRYHFRLVVFQGSYPTEPSAGIDRAFRTKIYGRLSLRRRRLRVKGRTVTIPLKCTGAAGAVCSGKLAITARGANGATVRCAGGRFSIHTGRHSVKKHVRGGCLALLGSSAGRRRRARFSATLTTNQRPLKRRAVLFE